MPREPYQRCSQAIFEAWLKPRIQAESHIDSHFGLKFESLTEREDGVESTLVDVSTGEKHIVHSQYVLGCDGAGSRVRMAMGSELIGGPIPTSIFLVHFKSRDLTALQKYGQFWHIFLTAGSGIIAQDEVDTWTVHWPMPLGTDWETLSPEKVIYDALGGSSSPYPIKIDQILVKSTWRPNIYVAERFASSSRRIFICGDAAHQNIPTGGYGMNTAVGDCFDIGWKLAAILHGYGGKYLLDSYEAERKPVAVRNIERSGVHWKVHGDYQSWVRERPGAVLSDSEEGKKLRARIAEHFESHDGENQDHGIEMGYRYNGSPVVVPDGEVQEPEWNPRNYIPSTWPGSRVPHVFLEGSETSIFDLLGPDYTIVDFSEVGKWATKFSEAAARLNIPLLQVHLPEEKHVRDIWGREAVLIRPDDHVSWRAPINGNVSVDVEQVLKIATGRESALSENSATVDVLDVVKEKGFTSTLGNVDQNKVEGLAAFQK
ncbi:hypothetical protein GQ53DRAFT_780432 [Thozetella sp. PMI_491]|nr:hypothetical protein GQ53DRAFT_780432 [Thozetella sp. PMI_491]